jgi:hypothetical protein
MNKRVLFVVFILFLWGILFLVQRSQKVEPFVTGNCPTTLVKDGEYLFLYDPKKAQVPGVNPIQMKGLEDYKQFIEWQRAISLKCPILHLEKVYSAQGEEMYEIRHNFLDPVEGGVPHEMPCKSDALTQNPPYNANQFPSYDKENQTQGNPGVMTLALR